MSAVDDILQNIPMGQLASQLGVDEQTAESATRQAIPALLGGLQANAQDPAGAASLAGALDNHSSELIDGGVDLSQVNTSDGNKIVSNIFGAQQDGVVQTLGGGLGGVGGGQGDLIKKLLPLLAPIVMSYLAKRMGGAGGGAGGGLLGSILGGVTGGAAGGGLSDILGSMLGGGAPASQADPTQATLNPTDPSTAQPQGSGNPILDMLGGMLGGGRR